jgi:hypothetical protein
MLFISQLEQLAGDGGQRKTVKLIQFALKKFELIQKKNSHSTEQEFLKSSVQTTSVMQQHQQQEQQELKYLE